MERVLRMRIYYVGVRTGHAYSLILLLRQHCDAIPRSTKYLSYLRYAFSSRGQNNIFYSLFMRTIHRNDVKV